MIGSISSLEEIQWPALIFSLKNRKLVPFLGAGASIGSNGAIGLPSGGELAKILAKECGYAGDDMNDLPRVAQYFALAMGGTTLRQTIQNKLNSPSVKPSEVHDIIAKLPIEVVLTTNFDSLMERAFVKAEKNPICYTYERRGNTKEIGAIPTIYQPLVYKLHGSIENKDTMVVTEDDTIDFLVSMVKGDPKIPAFIGSLFATSCILFVGYGLKDWNIRVLLRYFRDTQADIRSFAVQRFSSRLPVEQAEQEWKSMILYWEYKKVSIYNCDAVTFLRELDRRFQQEE